MKRLQLWIGVLAVLLLAGRIPPASATSYVVTPEGTGDFPTIQAAIAAVIPGDVIELADGVFTGDGNRDLDFLGKAITVRSQSGDSSLCVIDCDGSPAEPHRGFWFHSYEDSLSVLQGVSIINGFASDFGGGVLCGAVSPEVPASPTIRNCVLAANTAAIGAGLAVVATHCMPTIRQCVFTENTGAGAGWFITSSGPASAREVSHCHFIRNNGPGVAIGGTFATCGVPLPLEDCSLAYNTGDGITSTVAFGSLHVYRCEIMNNRGWGLLSTGTQDMVLDVDSSLISGNDLGGIKGARQSTWTHVTDCRVLRNGGDGMQLGFFQWISRSVVRGNAGHAICFAASGRSGSDPERQPFAVIQECDLSSNGGCGVQVSGGIHYARITGCTINKNTAHGIALQASCASGGCYHEIRGNTISYNAASGLYSDTAIPSQLGHNIFAFNTVLGIDAAPEDSLHLECTDIYGNGGGDWVEPIAGQYGMNGNIAADPLFCNASLSEEGDSCFGAWPPACGAGFHLASLSPCLLGPCGQIGALGHGCFTKSPRITSIVDVGNDQGRQVRVMWLRSLKDASGGALEVTAYGLYRRQDEVFEQAGMSGASRDPEPAPLRLDGWDFVGTIPARGDSIYEFVAPTVCDSTIVDGMCWSVFLVSAMTPDPLVYFDSPPDSGYSRDNLAPHAPENLRYESPTTLAWSEAAEEDFDHFTVYGSEQPDFDESAEFIAHTIEAWVDVSGYPFDYYHVTATDLAGNEGLPASVGAASDVLSDGDMPTRLALGPIHPNPGGAEFAIRLDLPQGGPLRVVAYDVTGKRVRTLASGPWPAGRHVLTWSGDDQGGRRVPAGLYFISMEAGETVRTEKVVRIR